MRLILSPAAAGDLDRLKAFLAAKDTRAAQNAVAALKAAIDSLEYFPGRGRPVGLAGVRN